MGCCKKFNIDMFRLKEGFANVGDLVWDSAAFVIRTFKGWWEFSLLIPPVEGGLHETMSLNLKPECSDRRLGLCYSLGLR